MLNKKMITKNWFKNVDWYDEYVFTEFRIRQVGWEEEGPPKPDPVANVVAVAVHHVRHRQDIWHQTSFHAKLYLMAFLEIIFT